MPSKRPALSGPLHVIWHAILVIVGWCLFGGFWYAVLLQKSHSLSNIVWLLASALILLPVITLYWVLHNRGIHSRKGPRQQVQVVEASYEQDWAGRPVHANFDQIKLAYLVTIESTAEQKRFLAPIDALQPQPKAA